MGLRGPGAFDGFDDAGELEGAGLEAALRLWVCGHEDFGERVRVLATSVAEPTMLELFMDAWGATRYASDGRSWCDEQRAP